MPRVSVLIPVRNGERFIAAAIDSVLTQTFKDVEVIVVDDASTDGTPGLLDSYQAKISRVRLPANRGQAAALNAARAASSGEYIALLDADDACAPLRLETQVAYLDSHPEMAMVYTDRIYIDANGRELERVPARAPDGFSLLQRNYVPRSSVMVRRVALDEAGPFDEANTGNDDWDMWVRLSEKRPLGYVPSALVQYRVHDRNISRTRRRPLDYYRKTRMRMLEGAHRRRGRPWWLGLMVLRARIEWVLGRPAWYGERFPRAWSGAAKIAESFERAFLRRAARPKETAT